MKGDFSRQTFRGDQHYRAVLQQEGRMLLDSDWNEQALIQAHLDELVTTDSIGAHGGPADAAGMAIVLKDGSAPTDAAPGDLLISPGRYYVGGILCENETPLPLAVQPDLPDVALPIWPGSYVAYLDVWQEHLTYLERPELREVALHGPDTATRTRTVWQLRLRAAGTAVPAAGTGQLRARAKAPDDALALRAIPASTGYRRLENQLYRVEIHDPTGATGGPSFVWSRENGSVATRLLRVDGAGLVVESTGRDDRLKFDKDEWVEVVDLARTRRGEHGYLGRVDYVDGNTLVMAEWRLGRPPPVQGDLGSGAVVRRWESKDAQPIGTTDWIPLEDGVQIQFASRGTFSVGDYWLIPARSENLDDVPGVPDLAGDVLWPRDAAQNPIFQPAEGIRHQYADVAKLFLANGKWSRLSDDRNLFQPLTKLTAQLDVEYAGGDGQQTVPGAPLPQPLEVSAARGRAPAPGVTIRFTAVDADGRVAPSVATLAGAPASVDIPTDADGVARCYWQPADDPTRPSQRVSARWVTPTGVEIDPPIDFSARLTLASSIAFDPAGCVALAGAVTVQDAVHTLADLPFVVVVSGSGQDARHGSALPQPVEVQVRARCGDPVPNATVRFVVGSGAVAADPMGLPAGSTTLDATTDANGVAGCRWRLGDETPVQTLTASLRTSAGTPDLRADPVTVVAGAMPDSPFAPGLHVTRTVLTVSPQLALRNDDLVAAADLAAGMAVVLDAAPDAWTVDGKPVFAVTLNLPYPVMAADRAPFGNAVVGTVPLTLAGSVAHTQVATDDAIEWYPTSQSQAFLLQLFTLLSTEQAGDRVLCQLTVSGRTITGAGGVLNGLSVSGPGPGGGTVSQLPSVDDVRGADFTLFFWLVQTVANLVLVPNRTGRLAYASAKTGLALLLPRDALRSSLPAGISATAGPGQNLPAARQSLGRAFRNGAAKRFVLVAQDRYAGAAGVIRDAFGSAGVTVEVISTVDPVTEVTTRQTNGLTVDGILTDDEYFATLAGLADFIEMVPL